MKLRFFKEEDLDRNVRATIHKTGKIGFTLEAAKKLRLAECDSVDIAINEDDETDENFYVVLYDSVVGGGLFNVSKSGSYYYINAKALLDKLKIPYETQIFAYNITLEKIDGKEVYVFKKRPPRVLVENIDDEEDIS